MHKNIKNFQGKSTLEYNKRVQNNIQDNGLVTQCEIECGNNGCLRIAIKRVDHISSETEHFLSYENLCPIPKTPLDSTKY